MVDRDELLNAAQLIGRKMQDLESALDDGLITVQEFDVQMAIARLVQARLTKRAMEVL